MTFWYRKNWETCSAYNFLGDFSDVEYEGQLKINADKIKEFYFGNKDINLDDETFSNLTNLYTDTSFMHGSDYMAR